MSVLVISVLLYRNSIQKKKLQKCAKYNSTIKPYHFVTQIKEFEVAMAKHLKRIKQVCQRMLHHGTNILGNSIKNELRITTFMI